MSNKIIALVTGASSGIGFEMADLLADKGYHLLLVSNDEKGLENAQKSLTPKGVEVDVLCLDLARPNAAQELVQFCDEQAFEVEVLVNNAGFFFFGEIVDSDAVRAQKMVDLHILTVSQLCILLGNKMRKRQKGYILNTSSIAAMKPFPGIGFYAASKAFITTFTRALRYELKVYGIHVTSLNPGATATNLYDSMNINIELGKKVGVMLPPRFVAKKGIQGLFRNKFMVVPGISTKIMLFFAKLTPQWLIYIIRKHNPLLKPLKF